MEAGAMLTRTRSSIPQTPASCRRLPFSDSETAVLRRSRSLSLSLSISGKDRLSASFRRLCSDATTFVGQKNLVRSSSVCQMPPTRIRGEDILPVPREEVASFSGDGAGRGHRGKTGGGDDGDDGGDHGLGSYYKELLRADPENPLILMNYGKYLHEVAGDAAGAEECYGRAVLAGGAGDGEALSLYGSLVWEAYGDGERAEAYFQRAVQASPEDCYVLGSYAHFLWDSEDEEDQRAPVVAAAAAAASSSLSASAVV